MAINRGYRRIVAVGGDGTNNEVVNGIFSMTMNQMVTTVNSTDIWYTLFPIGTGNDWTKTYGIPRNIPDWIHMLKKQHIIQQDVGRVTYFVCNGTKEQQQQQQQQQQQRFFVNVAGMAYDAYICKMLQSNKQGGISNRLVYLWMVFQHLFRYTLRRARIQFDKDFKKTIVDSFYTINVGLCKYSGGGMQLVPHAVVDDGYFAVTVACDLTKLEVVMATPRFYNGNVEKMDKVTLYKAKHIRVEAIDDRSPTLLEVDGEFLGQTPVEFTILEKALNVVVP